MTYISCNWVLPLAVLKLRQFMKHSVNYECCNWVLPIAVLKLEGIYGEIITAPRCNWVLLLAVLKHCCFSQYSIGCWLQLGITACGIETQMDSLNL